ncbi:MAG: pyrroline-5-carboxylate reductase [Blautia sp.]|nr:pyrroline-5-carboxylate reductase [Blautia sp.]
MNKIGFLGMGNMAQALAAGFLKSGLVGKDQIYAFAPDQEKLKRNAERIGFVPVGSAVELASRTDTVIMACKPYQIEEVLGGLGDALNGKTLLSICAGWDYARYQKYLDPSVRFQFIMPNTPAMVGEGVLLFESTNSLETEEREQVKKLFSQVGIVIEMPSHLMGIGGAVSGCGPAFVDLLMEAYADAAVKYGIPRKLAYELVTQTVLGSAALQLESGEHPAVLKDQVCSPAGTTIRGCAALEEAGFRNACLKSIDAVMNSGL